MRSKSEAAMARIFRVLVILAILGVVTLVGVKGVSVYVRSHYCTFEAMGRVCSAVDGTPLPTVRVAMNTSGQKELPDADWEIIHTDQRGEFQAKEVWVLKSRLAQGAPNWYLKFESKGYVTEFVEVSPIRPKPSSPQNAAVVSVISMRPQE